MKKKKIIPALLAVFALTLTAACGSGEGTQNRTANKQSGVEDVLAREMSKSDTGSSGQNPLPEPSKSNSPEGSEAVDGQKKDGIDIDLTVLSANMVYAEVYNMMTAPEDYLNKTIRMKGTAATYHDEATKKDYYACIIADATACCSQGIEFELTGGDKYPGDGQQVCVTGVFTTYKEGENMFCTLKNAKLA